MWNISEQFIDNIKNELYCDDTYIRDILELTPFQYEFKLLTKGMDFDDLVKVAQFFSISIEDIKTDNVDYSSIRKEFFHLSDHLPARYLEGGGTYISNIKAMLNYIKYSTNQKTVELIMNQLEITPAALRNESLLVNISLADEILQIATNELCMNQDDIRNMVIHSYSSTKRKELLSSEDFISSPRDMAKYIADNSQKFEQNFTYKFKDIDDELFSIETTSTERANESRSQGEIISDLVIKFKQYSIELLPILMNKPKLSIIDTITTNSISQQKVEFLFKDNSSGFFQ